MMKDNLFNHGSRRKSRAEAGLAACLAVLILGLSHAPGLRAEESAEIAEETSEELHLASHRTGEECLVSHKTCDCGRWTCHICQSQCDCPLHRGQGVPHSATPGEDDLSPPLPRPDTATEGDGSSDDFAADTPPIDSIATDSSLAASFGATAAGYGDPAMIGDFFGGGYAKSNVSRVIALSAPGTILTGTPGDPSAQIAFNVSSFGANGNTNDLVTMGLGEDRILPSPDADTFAIAAPNSPTDAPTSPGYGFTFGGGEAHNPKGTFSTGDFWSIMYFYDLEVVVPAGGAQVVGRTKIAENSSPIPRDRVFFNYSLFDSVPLAPGGVTVNRYSPGVEKTFHNGQMSLELRTPFASTLNSTIMAGGTPETGHTEFGDILLTYKALLYGRRYWAMSAGFSITFPTSDGTSVSLGDGTPLVAIDRESFHVMPYLGWLLTDRDRWFSQGFLQVDIDTNGDPVYLNRFGEGLLPSGRIQDTNFLFLDVGVGYWLYRQSYAGRHGVRGVAPTMELHVNQSLNDADVVRVENFRIGDTRETISVVNLVLGGTVEFGGNSTLSLGYATPLGNGSDRAFNGELRAFWNRFF